jgi:hypothetical protein
VTSCTSSGKQTAVAPQATNSTVVPAVTARRTGTRQTCAKPAPTARSSGPRSGGAPTRGCSPAVAAVATATRAIVAQSATSGDDSAASTPATAGPAMPATW